MNTTVTEILALVGLFFAKNSTVQEVEGVLPSVMAAIGSARVGQSFSVSFPLSVDGKSGTATFGWSPS